MILVVYDFSLKQPRRVNFHKYKTTKNIYKVTLLKQISNLIKKKVSILCLFYPKILNTDIKIKMSK